ncbi:hypothetical protein CRG98_002979 [Punica granatum]|uniref:Uncharacterized protein n=1 Tax=Punica granatum TaxID=22663 RepID=A0A2I0L7Q0_PUNGR|nr:hypothetical protein CRG98_002979 [Punica granatum]
MNAGFKLMRGEGRAALTGCQLSPLAQNPQIAGIRDFPRRSVEILTEKGKRLQLNGQKDNSKEDEQNPVRENGKFALVLGNFEIGRIRNLRRKTAKFSPIPTVLTPVRPRSATAKRQRCPEPSPASIPALTAASRGKNRRSQRRHRRSRQSRPPAG